MGDGVAAGPGRPTAGDPPALAGEDLGRIAYRDAWELQRTRLAARAAGQCDDVVLFCEHDPVITTGRRTGDDFLVEAPGGPRFEVVEVERGGEATYHGPGQIVAYPIVKLADTHHDLHGWLRALEAAVMAALADGGLATRRVEGSTGVWTADGARKLCSIGVAASRWVTWHGLALNHATDLEHFGAIRPCGFTAGVMTSVVREQGAAAPTRDQLVARLVARLSESLGPFREADAG